MNINIIHTKDKNSENGFVYVNYTLPNHPPKRVSTKIKMLSKDFKKYYDNTFKNFKPNKQIDFTEISSKIELMKTQNPFEKLTTKNDDDFIKFFEEKIPQDVLVSEGSQISYTHILNKLKKHYPILLFKNIDNNMRDEYFLKLKTEKTKNQKLLSNQTIKNHFVVIKKYIGLANRKKKANIVFDFVDLKFGKKKKKPNLLSDKDMDKLLKYPSNERYYYDVTFGLLQYFGNGLRFSDLLFLKVDSFKDDYVALQSPKTNDYINVPYSAMFVRTLYKYLFRDNNRLMKIVDFDLIVDVGRDNDNVTLMKNEIIIELKRLSVINKHPYVFQVPKELQDYDFQASFTKEQFISLNRERTKQSNHLQFIAKSLELDCKRLSTHAFRYKFVDTCLNNKVDIYKISKALNHKSIAITELYIRRNFNLQDNTEISNIFDSIHLR